MLPTRRVLSAPALLLMVLPLIAGCSANFSPTSSSSTGPVVAMQGTVFGGQQPIVGASVYMYAASTTGYGTAATSLLQLGSTGVTDDGTGTGVVTTDANGKWSVTTDYNCPAGSLVYFVARGGNPGLAPGTTNAAIAEVAAFGPCSSSNLNSSTVITMNELTTVAAMSALAPFYSPTLRSFSTSPTNVTGLTNAFVTANNLVPASSAAGPAPGVVNAKTPSGLGVTPVNEINSLADILSSCINSTGVGGNCATLFTATTPPVGAAPTNTAQAMYEITENPAQNTATLFGLIAATPPYTPILPVIYSQSAGANTAVPNDWTLAITYAAVTNWSPNYLALDSQSNVWAVVGQYQSAYKFSNAGALDYTVPGNGQLSANNYNQVLAIDTSDNLWVDNNSYGVSEISSSGVLLSPATGYGYEPGPGTNATFGDDYVSGYGGVAIDPNGDVLIGSAANNSSALVIASSTGFGLEDYGGGGLINPIGIAVDASGNIWMANGGGSYANPMTAVEFNPTTGVPTSHPAGSEVSAIAFDGKGDAWIANYGGSSLTVIPGPGVTTLGAGPYTGGGLGGPSSLAIDGAGNVWASNFGSYGVSEFNGTTGAAISPKYGFNLGAASAQSGAVAVDSSGNVWVANWSPGSVSESVGIAAPTINPVVVAAKNNTFGTKP
jgi:hypothetical protein